MQDVARVGEALQQPDPCQRFVTTHMHFADAAKTRSIFEPKPRQAVVEGAHTAGAQRAWTCCAENADALGASALRSMPVMWVCHTAGLSAATLTSLKLARSDASGVSRIRTVRSSSSANVIAW